jgi:hypothetical protein
MDSTFSTHGGPCMYVLDLSSFFLETWKKAYSTDNVELPDIEA